MVLNHENINRVLIKEKGGRLELLIGQELFNILKQRFGKVE